MSKLLENILSLLLSPLIILNVLGSFVSIIWLLILGQWKLVIAGFISGFLFQFAYTLPALIHISLGLLVYKFAEKRQKFLAVSVAFINIAAINFINLLWVFIIY